MLSSVMHAYPGAAINFVLLPAISKQNFAAVCSVVVNDNDFL